MAACLGWGSAAEPALEAIGGATKRTWKLVDKAAGSANAPAVLRVTEDDKPWTEGIDIAGIAREFEKARISPRVLGVTKSAVAWEFAAGRALDIHDIIVADGEVAAGVQRRGTAGVDPVATLTLLGRLTGVMHALPTSGEMPWAPSKAQPFNEILKWRDIGLLMLNQQADAHPDEESKRRNANTFESISKAELRALMPFNTYDRSEEAMAARSPYFASVASERWAADVATHGDLHLGNALFTRTDFKVTATDGITLVDVDRVMVRRATTDLGYFFSVWGSEYFKAGAPFKMDGSHQVLYPPLASRKLFLRGYVAGLLGDAAAAALSEADEAALLFDVEVAGLVERFRYASIMMILSCFIGDMMVMAGVNIITKELPKSRELLHRAIAEQPDPNSPTRLGPLRSAIVEHGLACAAMAEAA